MSASTCSVTSPLVLTSVPHQAAIHMGTTASHPFSRSVPQQVPATYLIKDDESQSQTSFAIYTLTTIDPNSLSSLCHTISTSTADSASRRSVTLMPKHDFSGETLVDVYSYHVNLLERGLHGIAAGKFIAVVDADWRKNGVLLVDFDTEPAKKVSASGTGTSGMVRLPVDTLMSTVRMLEDNKDNWAEIKEAEWARDWSQSIAGYTGTELQKPSGISARKDSGVGDMPTIVE